MHSAFSVFRRSPVINTLENLLSRTRINDNPIRMISGIKWRDQKPEDSHHVSSFTKPNPMPGPGTYNDQLKRWHPKTPSLRHTVLVDRSHLWKGKPVWELTKAKRKKGGRNNQGRITVRHRGGGYRRRYRLIDFKRNCDLPGIIQRFEYDPNRSAWIALIAYEDGTLSYILAPQNMDIGDRIEASREKAVEIKDGNAMPIKYMPLGTVFHNMEIMPKKGGQVARAAGTFCTLIEKDSKPKYALVDICSKERRYVLLECMATIGVVSNPLHNRQSLGKAGRRRNMGWRPSVRGVAMNPVDHPMGGGEGKSSGGRHSCSPNGILSKGYRTRRRRPNPLVIVRRGGKEAPTKRRKHRKK